MEKIRIKAKELSKIVHEVKFTASETIIEMRKLHDANVAVCHNLIDRAQTLLTDLDKMLIHIETDEPKRKRHGKADLHTAKKR